MTRDFTLDKYSERILMQNYIIMSGAIYLTMPKGRGIHRGPGTGGGEMASGIQKLITLK